MDTSKLLRSLNERNVRYVVIGATAFPIHGYARATLDVDIFIEPTRENAERVHAALRDFGYDVTDVSTDDLLSKKVLIRQYVLQTDIHPFVKGVTFEEVWSGRVPGEIGTVPAYFAGLDQLIQMKRAADRPKDREDLRVLEALRDKKR
jgi:predicted nucleotidyltransferase